MAPLRSPCCTDSGGNSGAEDIPGHLPAAIFKPLKGQTHVFPCTGTGFHHPKDFAHFGSPNLTTALNSGSGAEKTPIAPSTGSFPTDCCLLHQPPGLPPYTEPSTTVIMPPESQRPLPCPKKAPTTPASKSSNWSALAPEDDGSASSLSNQIAGGAA